MPPNNDYHQFFVEPAKQSLQNINHLSFQNWGNIILSIATVSNKTLHDKIE